MQKSVCFFVITLCGLGWAADFQAGLDAYDRGDYATALQEWQPIADRGDANAEYNVALLLTLGKGVTQDLPRAADWYRKAAEHEVPAAQYNLGVLYANGQGVPQDDAQAINWLLKAAGHGVQEAEVALAEEYYHGNSKNYAEAEKWFRKAAERGDPSAAFHLGVMYDLGQGVPSNYAEAIQWYTKAADAGYAPALTNLGILYYNAQGVKRDLVQAYAWFARAQKMGDALAAQLVRTTAERMKPKDLHKAQAEVDQWHPAASSPPKAEDANLFKQPATAPAGSGGSAPATGSAERSADPAPATQADPH